MRTHRARAAFAALLLVAALAPHAVAAPAPRASAVAAAVDARHREALRRHPLRTLDGRTLTLADLADEVVVINFWASWCRPCRRELPALDALHRELARGPAGARGRVVAVSIDAERENARRFVRERQLALPVCHDGPDALARLLDLDRVPTTLVMDRGGAIVFVHSGGADPLPELRAVTRRLLAVRTAAVEPGGTP